jgi:hypothetical protein
MFFAILISLCIVGSVGLVVALALMATLRGVVRLINGPPPVPPPEEHPLDKSRRERREAIARGGY